MDVILYDYDRIEGRDIPRDETNPLVNFRISFMTVHRAERVIYVDSNRQTHYLKDRYDGGRY